MGVTTTLSAFTAGIRLHALPPEVVTRARFLVLDLIGNIVRDNCASSIGDQHSLKDFEAGGIKVHAFRHGVIEVVGIEKQQSRVGFT